MADRALRICTACGGVDDHPRHVIVAGGDHGVPSDEFFDNLPDNTPASAIREAIKPGVVVRHIDCCAEAGCLSCQEQEKITKGLRGEKLYDALVNKKVLKDYEAPEDLDLNSMGVN